MAKQAKQKTAFTVTITTDGPASVKKLAAILRSLGGTKMLKGVCTKWFKIVKVTVTPISEK